MMEKYWERRKSGEGGFTLVELLVVIAILGILAAIVTFAVGGITDRGDKSACAADVKTLRVAVEAYNAEEGSYPANEAALPGALVPGFIDKIPDGADFDYAGGVVTSNCPD